MTIYASHRVLWPDDTLSAGWVRVEDDVILATGAGTPDEVDATAPYLSPGLVDMHCHGGGGYTFATDDPEEAAAAVALHRRHGTSTVVASLVTAPPDVLERQVRTLAPLVHDGVLAGIHLEGPWLSPAYKGAHDPAQLRHPQPAEIEQLLSAGDGTVRMVTLAPELPGAAEAIAQLVAADVVVAVGHTDTDADGLRAAVDAGARVVTHLCNAMRPIHHRDPGPIVAALADSRLTIELIVDGVHLHPDVVSLLIRSARGPVALITDAIAAAGCGDGAYQLGELPVTVTRGVARLTHGGSIAGSTLILDRAVRGAVVAGMPVAGALASATRVPAQAIGLPAGRIQVGAKADLLLLDGELSPVLPTI